MDKGSMIRTILLVVALFNQTLAATGKSPLPFSDHDLELGVSTLITAIVSIWTWWKNNYISKRGQKQKEVLELHNLYKE